MNSNANELVLAALQQVVGDALKCWLDDNKPDVLHAIQVAVTAQQPPPPPSPPVRPSPATPEPKFLNTAEIAARWRLHPETVRRLIREGRLPRMYVGRRRLVPMSAVLACEEQGWVPSRR